MYKAVQFKYKSLLRALGAIQRNEKNCYTGFVLRMGVTVESH